MTIHRREFLKLSQLLFYSTLLPRVGSSPDEHQDDANKPNFLILVFDALSAMNMSLYGYPRETTPNIDRIAARATVYHNHYAGGHWTYPGTASLLTGVLPWTHRAFSQGKPILAPHDVQNIFGLLGSHHRMVFTHNPLAEDLLFQMDDLIEQHQDRYALFHTEFIEFSLSNPYFLTSIFGRDYDAASVSWIRQMTKGGDGYANSLFFSNLVKYLKPDVVARYQNIFPEGPPQAEVGNYYFLEDSIDWIAENSLRAPSPYLAYYHLMPPHQPYSTRADFYNRFIDDSFLPVEKESHFLGYGLGPGELNRARQKYDVFILYADAEIGRLIDTMEANGSLDNTWVILTSDHGEMFERGIHAHSVPVFYQPVCKVPLMILPPRQTTRQDIYAPTSAVDLLPTLLHIDGEAAPDFLEGDVLPPFSSKKREESLSIFSLDARRNSQLQPLKAGTIMLQKDSYKLTCYFGYDELPGGEPYFELYDLAEDPEELQNLYDKHPLQAKRMRDELLQTLDAKNRLYN